MKHLSWVLVLVLVLLVSPGCGSPSLTEGVPRPTPPARSIVHASAWHQSPSLTVTFVDGTMAEYPEGALVHRARSKRLGGEVLIVHGPTSLAAYKRSAIRAVVRGGSLVSPDVIPVAGGGGGDGGSGSYCDPSIQDCPVCSGCSGPVPDGQFGDMDCLNGFNCSVDSFGQPLGSWVFRFLQPTNLTCTYDFDTGDASCDFDATNTGNGGDAAGNHLISYAYQFITQQVVMRCSPFNGSGSQAGIS